jgi:hypothetical protein
MFLQNTGSYKNHMATHPKDEILHSYCRENLKSYIQDRLFAENHSLIWERTLQKSSKFLPEIITLVSSANIIGIDEVFTVGWRSFI